MALDEVELEWADPRAAAAGAPGEVTGARIVRTDTNGAVFTLDTAQDIAALASLREALQAANRDSVVHLVIYDRNDRRGASRRVLTSRVSIILSDPADPTGVLEEFAARSPRAVPSVPGAYVLSADDPFAAVQLLGALEGRRGIKSASPEFKREMSLR